jgi:hypothetical protein
MPTPDHEPGYASNSDTIVRNTPGGAIPTGVTLAHGRLPLMASLTCRLGLMLATIATLVGMSACKSAPSPSADAARSSSPISDDLTSASPNTVPSDGPTARPPAPTTKPPTPKSTRTTAPAATSRPADTRAPVIVGPVKTTGIYLLPEECGSPSNVFSVKVSDATDAATRLKVSLIYHQANGNTGTFTMKYNSSTGLFEVPLQGRPMIPEGDTTFTVNASDPTGNRASPLAGPTLNSTVGCG